MIAGIIETLAQFTRSTMTRYSLQLARCLFLCIAFLPAADCLASFHFMQIEKIVGGVNGDTGAQAIQLRMRAAAQEQVNRGKLIAFDAAGENPIVLIDFDETVRNSAGGDRVLVATMAMRAYTQPATGETFLMEQPIPESYLAAGSIIFVNDEDTLIVWRFSWGGDAYTGETTGALTNDNDREFGPPFTGPLPSNGLRVIEFVGDFAAKSTSNVADYRLSEEPGTLTNNSDETFTLVIPDCDDPAGEGPDSDADGLRDVCDECPDDGGKWEPGLCGCGVADTDSDFDGIPNCDEDNGNENQNGNDNGNVNNNDNTGGNDNDNENENTNSNTNDNTGNDNGLNGNDNEPSGNGNDNTGSGNDNSSGNENDNDGGNGGGSGSPRGCTPSIGVLLAGVIGLRGLRFRHTRK